MSVTNIIMNEEITLVQAIGGLFFCEESWIMQSRTDPSYKKVLNKEVITTRNENNDTESPRTELWDLPYLSNI